MKKILLLLIACSSISLMGMEMKNLDAQKNVAPETSPLISHQASTICNDQTKCHSCKKFLTECAMNACAPEFLCGCIGAAIITVMCCSK